MSASTSSSDVFGSRRTKRWRPCIVCGRPIRGDWDRLEAHYILAHTDRKSQAHFGVKTTRQPSQSVLV